jgi:ATP-dependent Lon protease
MSSEALSTVGIIIDDLDRQSTGREHGSMQEWLLSVLEPSTAKIFYDPFLLVEADLSTVSWILTANDTSQIVGALLDRVAIVEIDYPPADAAEHVVDALRGGVEREAGFEPGELALPPDLRDLLISAFQRDRSTLRHLRRALRAGLGAGRLGEDGVAAARSVLRDAVGRDDRPYSGGRGAGFVRESG